jgi:cytochrome P450
MSISTKQPQTTIQTPQPAQPASARRIPRYPDSHFLWGALNEFSANPFEMLRRLVVPYPDLVELRFGPFRQIIVNDPDFARHVLVNNQKNYVRPRNFTRILNLVSSANLFNSDGDYWLRQRRLLQPAFHRQRIVGFGQLMTDETEKLLARWERHDRARPVAVEAEMTDLTLAIVGRALFGVDMAATSRGRELSAGFDATSGYINYRFEEILAPPLWIPTKRNREFKRGRAEVQRITQAIIDERRRAPGEHHDFLQMLLELRYEDTDQGMTDEQLRSESGAFFFAGHETTANTLTFAFYLLAKNPQAEAKLHDELARVLGGRTPTIDDLPQLPYNRMVVEETMRLYPAAWATSRETLAPDTLGPYALPARQPVMISVTGIHRHPAYWENPDAFDPERFTAERSAARPKHAYLPFGEGPRMCIGYQFALFEAQLVLATIAQRYRLTVAPDYQVTARPVFTLRTTDGLPMMLDLRN